MSKIRERVEKVLKEIREELKMNGSDIELVEVKRGIVKVRILGHSPLLMGCSGMPFEVSRTELEIVGVEQKLKNSIPEIKKVEPVLIPSNF